MAPKALNEEIDSQEIRHFSGAELLNNIGEYRGIN